MAGLVADVGGAIGGFVGGGFEACWLVDWYNGAACVHGLMWRRSFAFDQDTSECGRVVC